MNAILRKVQSMDSVKKYTSPLPEIEQTLMAKKKKRVDKFGYVKAMVDASPPLYDAGRMSHSLIVSARLTKDIFLENVRLLCSINNASMNGGKVDSHWTVQPPGNRQYYERRSNMCKAINQENRHIYRRIGRVRSRVASTASLEADWRRNKRDIVQRARTKFVLFPLTPATVNGAAFAAPRGTQRPRVYITLGVRGAAVLGTLTIELFTDVCPATCKLFLDLLDGDGLGHGYVGTRFYRKVPHLFWSGGDVICDNGFGCYAQRGRLRPILAENYHFPHSTPGLLSMATARRGELCGMFHVTFKAMPQFDLSNVVFGRIVRPCSTYDVISALGHPLSTQPVVVVVGAKRWVDGAWVTGAANTKLKSAKPIHVPNRVQ